MKETLKTTKTTKTRVVCVAIDTLTDEYVNRLLDKLKISKSAIYRNAIVEYYNRISKELNK